MTERPEIKVNRDALSKLQIGMIFDGHRLCDPRYLPDHDEVISVVGGNLLATYGTELKAYREDRKKRRLSYPLKFGYRHGMYEILNREGIDRLTKYLGESALRIRPDGGKVKVGEVGAGLGRLTHFVCKAAARMGIDNLDMFASDSGDMVAQQKLETPFDVFDESYVRSLRFHKPQIVISSWMPQGDDWTTTFRNSQCVDEYILIGQMNACGKPDSWEQRRRGFARHILHDLSEAQIGYKDDLYPYEAVGEPAPSAVYNSKTVSFRREPTEGRGTQVNPNEQRI